MITGQSMPAPDRHTERRAELGHGVLAALHVPRRGARRPGPAPGLPQDGADAPGARSC